MHNINKKALSGIISSVLMLAIVIVSITLIGLSINNFIQPTLSPQFSCLDLQLAPVIKIEKACYNATSQETQLTLSRNLDNSELSSLEFTLDNNKYSCGASCPSSCIIQAPGNTKTHYFQQQASSITLSISNCRLEARQVTNCVVSDYYFLSMK